MLKKTIKYTNYNGEEQIEDFYFNLSKAELTEMELSTTGGYGEMLQGIVAAEEHTKLVPIIKDIIFKSYGEKSADGKRFMKSPELSTAFSQTEAYSELFMEIATDADASAAFVNGIIPTDVQQKVEEATKK